MRAVPFVVLVLAATAAADPRPTLDDFYERTRTRQDDFDRCIGYCDGRLLATLLVGAETATPDAEVGYGGRIGMEGGVRGDGPDIARAKLWGSVLRVDASGRWLSDLAGHLTAFKSYGEDRDDTGLNLSLDALVDHHDELRLADIAALQMASSSTVDTEAEVAYLGPKLDKDGHITAALGVANRIRWSGGEVQRRTSVSFALADRAFVRGMRNHAQLDFLRAKYTSWDTGAHDVTLSTGYQRLPEGLDTLPLWLLVGYEWTGSRSGLVAQIGMDLTYNGVRITPGFERHLELDPMTNAFTRVTSGRFGISHRLGFLDYGIAYEAASIEHGARFHALTPRVGIAYAGFELGVEYRVMLASTMELRNRFALALDRRF